MKLDNTALKAMNLQSDFISIEAVTMEGVSDVFSKRFPAFVTSVKNFFSGAEGEWSSSVQMISLDKEILKLKLADIAELEIPIPPGMKSDYFSFAKLLLKQQKIAEGIMANTIQPLDNFVAALLTNPMSMRDSRISVSKIPGLTYTDVDAEHKLMGKLHHKNRTDDTTVVGDAFNSIKDIDSTVKMHNDIVESLFTVSRKDLKAALDRIVENLDKIQQRATEKPDLYQLSPAVIKTISSATFLAARELEFFSVHSYRLINFSVALKDTTEVLKVKK